MEVQTIKALRYIFPGLTRTGSMAYKKAAADLVRPAEGPDKTLSPILLVVTKDKGTGHPLLVTLSAADLEYLIQRQDFDGMPAVYVQCKGRKQTWIGKLWRELRDATKE